MKPFLCIILAIVLLNKPEAQALFGHVAAERERRIEAQQQFEEQQHTNQRLFIVISVLSAGVVISLVIGAAVGSKTRRAHHEP